MFNFALSKSQQENNVWIATSNLKQLALTKSEDDSMELISYLEADTFCDIEAHRRLKKSFADLEQEEDGFSNGMTR
jgi:hypothetical protein